MQIQFTVMQGHDAENSDSSNVENVKLNTIIHNRATRTMRDVRALKDARTEHFSTGDF